MLDPVLEVRDLKGNILTGTGVLEFDPSTAAWYRKSQVEAVVSPLTRDSAGLHWFTSQPMLGADGRPMRAALIKVYRWRLTDN